MSSSHVSSENDDHIYDYSDNDDYFEGSSEYEGVSDEYIIAETGTVSPVTLLKRASYRVLSRKELARRQAEVVNQSAELLCVDPTELVHVLRYYKW